MKKKYLYPKLPAQYDLSFFRIGGSGLANCMFIAARAWINAKENKCQFISPTWNKFSPGPFLRGELDKRRYNKLFKSEGISGVNKMMLLLKNALFSKTKKIVLEEGLGNYFKSLMGHEKTVHNYFKTITEPYIFDTVNKFNFTNTVGIHIRLGDFPDIWRTDIAWYVSKVEQMQKNSKIDLNFVIFSDGTDEELTDILALPNVSRVFFGNALADIWALSKCVFIIGSDSTFSGWAVYLGQTPCVFAHKHYGVILNDASKEFIVANKEEVPIELANIISKL